MINAFLIAIVSTTGAFIPLFGLMYVHFLIRKNFYDKLKPVIESEIKKLEEAIKRKDDILNKPHKELNIEEIKDDDLLALKLKLNQDIMQTLIDLIGEVTEDIIKKGLKENDLEYIKTYNFKRYLIGLLNDRFPDRYFRSEEKK